MSRYREYFALFTIIVLAVTAATFPRLAHWMVFLAFLIGKYYVPFRAAAKDGQSS
jgi:hypothetical protein